MVGDRLDVSEVATLVGRHHGTLLRWRAAGLFPAPDARVAGRPVWDVATVESWKKGEARPINPAPEPVAPLKVESARYDKVSEGAEDSLVEFDSEVRIRTLEDALAHAEVDLEAWRVDRWECTSWEVGMKLRDFAEGKVTGETPVRKQLWRVKLYLKRILPRAIHLATGAIFERMKAYAPEYPRRPARREFPGGRHMMEVDLFDVHFGKLAWAPETGQNYDLKIAERVFRNAVEDLLSYAAGYHIDRIVFPIGSDFYHIDNPNFTTTAGTPQDVDGRYPKIYETGFMAMVGAIELAVAEADVDLIWIPGNHDSTTSYHLAQTLAVWFRNNPHVTVDYGPKRRKYVRYGNALVGFTHGNEEPARALPGLMATEMARDWGETTSREWRKGHVHKSKVELSVPVDTHDGVVIRTLRSLSATDAYHYRKGYGGPRAAEAYLTSREQGYAGHFVANVRD